MKKQNIAIIGVIAFVLAVAVGYALFSETITINGTATAKGDFDVEFTTIGTPTCSGYSKDCTADNLAVIATDKNSITVTVDKLQYPGAYVTIPVTVTNVGSIPAVLKSITETGLTTDSTVKVSYTGIAASDTPLAQNGTASFNVKVEWLSTSNTSSENVTFSIALNYEQVAAQ